MSSLGTSVGNGPTSGTLPGSGTSLPALQTRLANLQTQIASMESSGIAEYTTPIGNTTVRISLAEMRNQEHDLIRRINKLQRGRYTLGRRGVQT